MKYVVKQSKLKSIIENVLGYVPEVRKIEKAKDIPHVFDRYFHSEEQKIVFLERFGPMYTFDIPTPRPWSSILFQPKTNVDNLIISSINGWMSDERFLKLINLFHTGIPTKVFIDIYFK